MFPDSIWREFSHGITPNRHSIHSIIYLFIFISLQVLRDGQLQGGRDRRLEAEGGDAVRRGRHLAVQEGQPDHVRLGDPRQAPLRGRLLAGQRPQRQLHQ